MSTKSATHINAFMQHSIVDYFQASALCNNWLIQCTLFILRFPRFIDPSPMLWFIVVATYTPYSIRLHQLKQMEQKFHKKKILLLRSALVQIFANRDFWPITALCETNDIISGCIMWQVLSAINFIDGALRMHRYRHVWYRWGHLFRYCHTTEIKCIYTDSTHTHSLYFSF